MFNKLLLPLILAFSIDGAKSLLAKSVDDTIDSLINSLIEEDHSVNYISNSEIISGQIQ